MSDEKLEAFKVGDWQSRRTTPAANPREPEVQYQRDYPTFHHYLRTEDFSVLFQRCEQTCLELDRMIRTGNQQDAQEAQLAINAFGRSMQLATELLELKAKFRGR